MIIHELKINVHCQRHRCVIMPPLCFPAHCVCVCLCARQRDTSILSTSLHFRLEMNLCWNRKNQVQLLTSVESLLSSQPPLHRLWHGDRPRHPESLGRSIWAVGRRDPAEGMVRSSLTWGHPLDFQHPHAAIRFRLLHQQARLLNSILK